MKLKVDSKTELKYFTYKHIKSWNPCYDPIKFIPIDWKGTAVDILNIDKIPFEDRLWCVLRNELVSDKVMRLFAVWSYRQTLKFIKNPDPRSIKAANVAENFALGRCTKKELFAARSDAESAWSADESTISTGRFVAMSAAWSVDESARSAARSAARFAVCSATWSADESTMSTARFASMSAQKKKLIEMIKIEGKVNRKKLKK